MEEMLQLMRSIHLRNLESEIPPDGTSCPWMEELEPPHPMVDVWRGFKQEIFDLLIKNKPRDIAMPGFWEYPTLKGGEVIFVILLGGRDIANGFAEQIRADVDEIVTRHTGPHIIRFYELTMVPVGHHDDHRSTFGGPTLPFAKRTQWEHSVKAQMGYSIGPEFDSTAGTLCASVKLIDPKSREAVPGQFALTCHHVVDPNSWNPANADSVIMHCPAQTDSSATFTHRLVLCREEKRERGKVLAATYSLPDESLT
jgi:hypothetical protein